HHPPPKPRSFPYTTLFRSQPARAATASSPPSCSLVAAGNLDGEGDDEVVCWSRGSTSFWQRTGEEWREVYPARGPEDATPPGARSEEHTSELQSRVDLVCR